MGTQAEKYRDFTDTQGRTIRGRIVAYDATKKIVSFERDNRKTSKVPIGIFSEADQSYISEWDILRCFTDERRFKISVKRKEIENEGKSNKGGIITRRVKDTHYEINLENKMASRLKGINLEYCIYYEQEESGTAEQGVHCGTLAVDSIEPKSKKMLSTEGVSIFKKELDSGYYYTSGSDSTNRGDVHGVSIRVHLKLPSGTKETRECFFPETMKNKRWATKSIDVGMNKSSGNSR
jgi:hypothetical protein